MEPIQTQDHIDQFVLSLLRTGLLLTDVAGDLIESLPDDAYPEEGTGAAVLEMLSGTIRSLLETVDPAAVEQAADLIEQAVDRVEEHLRLALALSRRMHSPTFRPGFG